MSRLVVGSRQHGGFDWKGVAASAIASGVGSAVGQTALGKMPVIGNIATGVAAGAASTLVRGGSVGRNVGAISMDAIASTIGSLVVDNVASSSTNTSTLYGPGGDVDGMVQAAYPVDPGKEFAWQTNAQLNTGSTFDARAASLGLTTQEAYGLTLADNGRSIVGSPFSPDVKGEAVPYPQISVSALPDSTVSLSQTEGGFLRGLSGDRRSVFESAAPLSEKIGAGVRAAGEFIAEPLIEVGNQYRDVAAAASGATGGWHSAFAQQVTAGSYGGAALTEFGAVAGAMPLAGATLKGVASVAPAFADTAGLAFEGYAAKTGILAYAVDNSGARAGSGLTAFATSESVTVSGSRAIDLGQSYEIGVRGLYGEVPFAQRQYDALVGGRYVDGVADNVIQIGGNRVAVEAKFVDGWANSLRNPTSPNGTMPWAVTEQQAMVTQAMKYNSAFDQVIYHTNSVEFATHYTSVFNSAGINNFKFVITPATR